MKANEWNKRQRFSLRKLTVGLASTAIASFWLLGASSSLVLAQEQGSGQLDTIVNYYYVTEGELTEAEKAMVVHALPEYREDGDTCYAMVYRPRQAETALPKTGANFVDAGLGLAGLGLLVLVFKRSKTRKEWMVSVLLLSATGSLLLTPEAQALKSELLSAYNQQFNVMVGQALPMPMDVEGYRYVGYIAKTCSSKAVSIDNQETLPSLSNQVQEQQETRIPDTAPTLIDSPIEFEVHPSDDQLPSVSVRVTEEVTTEVIPFTEETVYSDDLYEGEISVSEGQLGQRTIVTHVHQVDNQVLYTEVISNEVTLAPRPRVVIVGKKKREAVSEPVIAIPDTAPRVIDLPADGSEQSVEVELTPADDSLPTAEITISEESGTEEIPFAESEPRYSNDLYEGETSIIAGQVGKRAIMIRIHKIGDEILQTEILPGEIIEEPVAQVTIIGTKPKDVDHPPVTPIVSDVEAEPTTPSDPASPSDPTTPSDPTPPVTPSESTDPVVPITPSDPVITSEDQPRTESIPFETQEEETEDLPEGERQIVNPGKEGILTIVTRITKKDDEVINEEEISRERSQEPVNELVRVGAKVDKTLLQLEREKEDLTKQADTYLYADQLKQQAYNQALIAAQAVLEDKKALKKDVAAALQALEKARQALDGRLKTVPTFTIDQLTKDEDNRTVKLTFAYTDPDQASIERKVSLYKNDGQLIKEVIVSDPAAGLELTDLEYYQDYTVKTSLIYNIGKGQVVEVETDKEPFRLEYKKIEFKDIDQIELYYKDGNTFRKKHSIDTLPSDPTNYFIKIKSDRFKDALLPIKTITDAAEQPNAYQFTVEFPELVQDKEKTSTFKENFSFFLEKPVKGPGIYTTFKDLVEAIKANPTGTFTLGANLSATDVDLPANAESYLSEFKGTLQGEHDGKKFAIYDLSKPLFNSLDGANISNLDFKDVNIRTNQKNTGTLANTAVRSNINDVAIQGSILASMGSVGGVIGTINSLVSMNNTLVKAAIEMNGDYNTAYALGGLVGTLTETSTRVEDITNINKSMADVHLQAPWSFKLAHVGGLVGTTYIGNINDSYSKGTLTYTNKPDGKLQKLNEITNAVYTDYVTVKNSASELDIIATDYKSTTNPDSKDQAKAKLANMGITATLDDSKTPLQNLYTIDYSTVQGASSDRKIAYENVEKLTPFYNKEYIVFYGNKIDPADKLYSNKLVDVVPMKDNEIIVDAATNKNTINKLMLHYADGTIEYIDVTYKADFKNNKVAEYTIAGKDLIYTPEQFGNDYTSVVNRLSSELAAINFDSQEVKTALRTTGNDDIRDLYLEDTFNEVKQHIAENLQKALAANNSINTLGEPVDAYLVKQIQENKAEFLLGLSYLNRWYNINYGDINTKDLTTFKNDFFGDNSKNSIDTIIALGKSGFRNLQSKNNVAAFKNTLADAKGKETVYELLEAYRERFLPEKTNNDWLKETTKAYIVESKSAIPEVKAKQDNADPTSKYTVNLYDRMKLSTWANPNMLLPLLTLKDESVYVITNMASISVGGYERYQQDAAKENKDPKEYVRELVNQQATMQRDHFDFWSKILTPESADKLFNNIINYDGYWYPDSSGTPVWETAYSKENSIANFFGPAGSWYGNKGREHLAAFAPPNAVYYIQDRLMTNRGTATYTHEIVHNLDGDVYFEGHGRREGQGPELFALGLLQSPDYLGEGIIGINHIFTGDPADKDRMHTATPNTRFNNAQDLQEYMKGMFDLIYLLDYAEAQAVLKLPAEAKAQWYKKIENYYVTDSSGKETHAGNKIRNISTEEAAALTTLESLIDNDILTTKESPGDGELGRDGYYTISPFSPIYSALSNEKGSPGDIMFRRMAFELLADKGYHEGFIPYVSQQYGADALAMGSKTSNKDKKEVGLITDSLILEKIYGGQYKTWADFKKAKYQERIDQKDNLKPTSIEYRLGSSRRPVQAIENFAKLQELMNAAVEKDASGMPNSLTTRGSWVQVLKKRIYNAYLRDTNDFTTSIFK